MAFALQEPTTRRAQNKEGGLCLIGIVSASPLFRSLSFLGYAVLNRALEVNRSNRALTSQELEIRLLSMLQSRAR
jgi:hypothetical protein